MALGSVSIIPYTRADVEKMLKRAMYSEGKLVFTGILSPTADRRNPAVFGIGQCAADSLECVRLSGRG